uniref:C2H2-type domain-containing protein n=2 Tax=Panagrellus redivivus TaxID=6233 RepID=A0A7E4ZYW0_PANRE
MTRIDFPFFASSFPTASLSVLVLHKRRRFVTSAFARLARWFLPLSFAKAIPNISAIASSSMVAALLTKMASNGLPKFSEALALDLADIHKAVADSSVDRFAHVLELAKAKLATKNEDLAEVDAIFNKLKAKRDCELLVESNSIGASSSSTSSRRRKLAYRGRISPYSTSSSTPTIRSPPMSSVPSDSSISRVVKTCPVCDQTFANRQSMLRHVSRKHPDHDASATKYNAQNDLPFQCDVCYKSFEQKSSLQFHMKRHTGKSFECPQCQRQYAHGSELRKHLVRSHKVPAAEISKDLKEYKIGEVSTPPEAASTVDSDNDDDLDDLLTMEMAKLDKAASD